MMLALALSLLACSPTCGLGMTAQGGECSPVVVTAVSEEEVSFAGGNGDLQLEGTLTLPQSSSADRLPAVVLVHGSGPNGRDEVMDGQLLMYFGFEVPVFAEIAAALARAGFIVLRYDKRTCFSGNGCQNGYPSPSETTGYWDFLADAQAAVDYLASREEVDAEGIVAMGHSQGGQVVPYLDGQSVRDIALLASPADPVDELLAYQRDKIIEVYGQVGASQAQIDAQTASLDELLAGLASLRAGTHDGGPIGGTSVDFWSEWLDASDRGLATTAAWPGGVLVVQGDYDWNIPVSQAEAFGGALAGHADADVQVLPELTHPFTRISEPDWTQVRPGQISEHVDAELTDAVVSWLRRSPQ